jgi:hypothetical protein
MVEALPVIEQAIGVLDRTGNLNVLAAADALSVRGFIRESIGDITIAENNFKTALEIRSELSGPKSMLVAKSLTNLGSLYLLTGELSKSGEMLKRAIDVVESVSQPDMRFKKFIWLTYSKELEQAGKKDDAESYRIKSSMIAGETMDCTR